MISLEEIDQVIQSGPFEPTWDSLSHQVCPDWYRDAKFGIFIHWRVCLQCTCLWFRMVFAKYVYTRESLL